MFGFVRLPGAAQCVALPEPSQGGSPWTRVPGGGPQLLFPMPILYGPNFSGVTSSFLIC